MAAKKKTTYTNVKNESQIRKQVKEIVKLDNSQLTKEIVIQVVDYDNYGQWQTRGFNQRVDKEIQDRITALVKREAQQFIKDHKDELQVRIRDVVSSSDFIDKVVDRAAERAVKWMASNY